MLLRIGVNLGDIIHDGTRTYGDGINVAARLEPLAEPGGICISANVRDAIFGKLGLPLRDIGEKSLKNIARPVHIFQIQPPGARARRDWLSAGLRHYRRLAPALGLVVLLAAIAGLGAWRFWPRETLTPDYTPIIAVLPFANTSGDKSLDSLGPSLAREVSSMLATYPLFRMVEPSGLPPQGADPGRRYTLDGDLLKSGDKLRVRAQLADAASGQTVWSDNYEFDNEDALAVQKKTAERVYGALGGFNGRMVKIEQDAAWKKPESSLSDYDYSLRASSFTNKFTLEDNLQGRKIVEGGLKQFPKSTSLKTALAWSYLLESESFGCFENYRDSLEMAYRLGREVEEAEKKSRNQLYETRKLMAHVYAWHGAEFERSIDEAEATAEMNPFDAAERAS